MYLDWKRRVIAAIEADPAAARAAFHRRYPEVLAAKARRDRERSEAQHRQVAEELLAAAYAAAGMSTNRIAQRLGAMSWATARARIQAGRLSWATDPAGSRAALVGWYERLRWTSTFRRWWTGWPPGPLGVKCHGRAEIAAVMTDSA